MRCSFACFGVFLCLQVGCQSKRAAEPDRLETEVDAGFDAQVDASPDKAVVDQSVTDPLVAVEPDMPPPVADASQLDMSWDASYPDRDIDAGVDADSPEQPLASSLLCPTSTPDEARCCIITPAADTHLSSDRVEIFGVAVVGDEGMFAPVVFVTVWSEFGMGPRRQDMHGDRLGYFRNELRVGTGEILIEVEAHDGIPVAHCEVRLTR